MSPRWPRRVLEELLRCLTFRLRTDLGACSGIWDRTRVAALARPSFLSEDARKRPARTRDVHETTRPCNVHHQE